MIQRKLRVLLVALSAGAVLAGCGLADTSAGALAEAESAAETAKQAKEMEAKVRQQVDAAQQAAAAQLEAVEKSGQ